MKNILYTTLLFISLFCCLSNAKAAKEKISIDTSSAYPYLLELEALLNNVSIEMYASYIQETMDSTGVNAESLFGYYVTSGTNYYNLLAQLDSPFHFVEYVQNDREHITVESESKLLSIQRRIPIMEAIFRLNLLDNQFVQDQVQRMYAIDSLGIKVIKVEFKPESPYLFYTLSYDTLYGQPLELEYAIKTANGSGGSATYDKVKIRYALWSPISLPPVRFSTAPYYIRQNGIYVLQPGFTDYEILDFSAF